MMGTKDLRRLALDGDFCAIHALLDRFEEVEKGRDALNARIKAMERQAPVSWTTKLALEHRESALGFRVSSVNIWDENGVPLYALPGAKGEEK